MKRQAPRRLGRRWGIALTLLVLVVSGTAPVVRGQARVPADRVAATSGPWSIGSGPPGPIEALLALPASAGRPAELLAGGMGRIAVSTDGGMSWHSSYGGAGLSGTVTTLLATGDGPTAPVLAGTTTGLFRSTDGGLHWTRLQNGLPTTTGMQVLARSGDTLFGGTGDQNNVGVFGGSGLFVSHDGGTTWAAVTLPNGSGPFISALLVNHGTLYVATVSGSASKLTGHLYVRPPGGAFKPSETGLLARVRIHALAAGAGRFVAGTGAGFYVSPDGAHWQAAVQGGMRPFVYTLLRDPARPQVVYGGSLGSGLDDPGAGIWQSGDGGQTWHPSSLGMPSYMDVHAIAVVGEAGAPPTYFAASDGVWRSRDALHWSAASSGLNLGAVRVLAADPVRPGTLVAGVSYSGFYRSTDAGRTWRVANAGLLNNEPVALAFGGSDALYAATDGLVLRWDAATTAWKGLDSRLNRRRTVTAFAVGPIPGGLDVLYVAGAFGTARSFALLRSTDLGRSWKTLAVPGVKTNGSPVRYISVGTTNPNVVYVATDTALYVSGNGGTTWTATGPPAIPSTIVTALAVDPASYQTAYVAMVQVDQTATSTATALTSATVYRTVDGGLRWVPVRRYGAATLILQIRPALRTLVAGAQLGGQSIKAVLDEQSGGAWHSLASGLPAGVYGTAVDLDGTRLYLGTGQHGVWARALVSPLPPATPGSRGDGMATPTPVLPGA